MRLTKKNSLFILSAIAFLTYISPINVSAEEINLQEEINSQEEINVQEEIDIPDEIDILDDENATEDEIVIPEESESTAESTLIDDEQINGSEQSGSDETVAAYEKIWTLIQDYAHPEDYLTDPLASTYTDEQKAEMKADVDLALVGCTTDMEKAKAIYTYVADRIYNKRPTNERVQISPYEKPYDVWNKKLALSEGYTNLTRTLCILEGIPAMVTYGDGPNYNLVYVGDNQNSWIFMDTFCGSENFVYQNRYDEIVWARGSSVSYDYFNPSISYISSFNYYQVFYVYNLSDNYFYYNFKCKYSDTSCYIEPSIWAEMSDWHLEGAGIKSDEALQKAKLSKELDDIPLTIVGSGVYSDNTDITEADFSDYLLKEVSDYAFKNCTNLQKIVLPHTVEKIVNTAFSGCSGLKIVNMENTSVSSIGSSCFEGCTSLETITMPSTLETLGNKAFYGCTGLKDVNMKETSVSSIGSSCFEGCTSLESMIMPSTLETLGNSAFYGCMGLKDVNMKETSVSSIGSSCFEGCISLETMTMPSTVETLGNRAFYGCTGLKDVNMKETSVSSIGSYCFDRCRSLETITMSTRVETIGDHAFYDCFLLETITLPSTVVTIGEYAFCGCSNLKTVNLEDTKVSTLGEGCFYQCKSLKKVILPSSLNSLGDYLFSYCYELVEVDLSRTLLQTIPEHAFLYNYDLENVFFPRTLNSIEEGAFCSCRELICLDFRETNISQIGSSAFTNSSCNTYILTSLTKENFTSLTENDSTVWGYRNLVFTDKCLTVRYDGNGAEGESMACTLVPGDVKKNLRTNTFTNGSKEFKHWNTKADGTGVNYQDGAEIPSLNSSSESTLTLYAIWDEALFESKGYQLTIGGNCKLKYQLDVCDALAGDEDAYIQFKVGNSIQNVKPDTISNGTATYTCEVPASHFKDTITATLNYAGKTYTLSEYSVYEYLTTIIDESDENSDYAKAEDIAKALLNYGGFSQEYFDYEVNELANDNVDKTAVTKLSDDSVVSKINTSMQQSGSLTGFNYYGTSLICYSDTNFRLYLALNNTMSTSDFKDNYSLKVNGYDNPLTYSIQNGMLTLTLSDIGAINLDNEFTFVISNGTSSVSYTTSPFAYIKSVLSNANSSETLRNLCKALYLYNQAAEAYTN